MAVGAGLMALTMDPTIILHDSEDSACDPCIPRDVLGMQRNHDGDALLADGPSPRTFPRASLEHLSIIVRDVSLVISKIEEYYCACFYINQTLIV